MGKNSFNTFSQLASLTQAAQLESAEASQVDQTGEDLGDVDQSQNPTSEQFNEDKAGLVGGEPQSAGAAEDDQAELPETAGEEPVKTLNDKPVQAWTDEELESYIAGEADCEIYYSKVEEAIQEHRIRDSVLPRAWSTAECITFFQSGVQPEQTSKGAWVKDVTRAERRESQWTTQELESWALGEIQPEGVTQATGLAIELKSRLNLSVQSVDVDAVIRCYKVKEGLVVESKPLPTTKVIAQSKTSAQLAASATPVVAVSKTYEGLTTMAQSYIENALQEFHSIMKPGKAVAPAKGGEAQKLLKEVITYAYSQPDPVASNASMRALFDHFAANRGDGQIFEDTYAFRFIENMRSTVKEQESHAALLTLFLAYADPMVELRSQTDVASLIKGVPAQYQSRLLEFFSKV